jgi:hypothetical protein
MSIARGGVVRGVPIRRVKQSDAGSAGPRDDVQRFADGDISRVQAMRALGIGYGELLDRAASRALPLPKVDDAEAEKMADIIVTLMAAD